MPEQINLKGTDNAIVQVIETAIQIPGVKVSRDSFLVSIFDKKDNDLIDSILRVGPVEAGIGRAELLKLAKSLVTNRTIKSTAMSFTAGLPGGIAMAATIPADTLQFFGISLRLAQEIAYLYGEEDLWSEGNLNEEKIMNTLILYCGVMFGASGASATLRVLSSQLGKQALKKIPKMALTKTFYYPIIKSITKFFGGRMTKGIFAKAVAKAVPLVGGVVSGGITFATLKPMALRLVNDLDNAKFSYKEEELNLDLFEIQKLVDEQGVVNESIEKIESIKISDEIIKNKELLDNGVITEAEFSEIKKRLIDKL